MKRMLSFLSCLALSSLAMSAVSPSSLADGGVLSKRRPAIGVPYEPLATDVYSWTGLYAGAGVGVYAGLAGLEGEGGESGPFNLDRISSWGFLGDVRLGYDYHLQGSPLLVGVFGGYTWGSAEAGVDIPGFTGSASLTPTWNLGGRVGLVAGRTLFYTGYKYSQADLEVSSVVDGSPISKRLSLRGHTALGGIEYAMTKALTVSLEYGYTRYQDVDMNVNSVDIHAEPEAHAVMLRGNLRFGTGQ